MLSEELRAITTKARDRNAKRARERAEEFIPEARAYLRERAKAGDMSAVFQSGCRYQSVYYYSSMRDYVADALSKEGLVAIRHDEGHLEVRW